MIAIDIRQIVDGRSSDVDPELRADRFRTVVEWILADAGYQEGEISIAIVDDPRMRLLNHRYLRHDYTTDVLSFRWDEPRHEGLAPSPGGCLDGELIVCRDTARRAASEYGWAISDELLLYVAHGALHLVGHDDATEPERTAMRQAEVEYLGRIDERLGLQHAQSRNGEPTDNG